MFATIFIWTVCIIIGVPLFLIAFAIFMARFAVDVNSSIDNPQMLEVPPESAAKIPTKRLRELLTKVEAKGYKQMLGYTIPSSAKLGMNNYIFVLYSPDATTYAEVFYIRAPMIYRFITLLFVRKHYHRYVLDVAFFSGWDNNSRLVTTPEINVASKVHQSDISQVMKGATLDSLIKAHNTKLSELCEERASCRRFQSLQDYHSFFNARAKLAHAQGPESVEDVLNADESQYRVE